MGDGGGSVGQFPVPRSQLLGMRGRSQVCPSGSLKQVGNFDEIPGSATPPLAK